MKSIIFRTALLLILGTLHSYTIGADDVSFDVKERALIEKRISIYEKYNNLIPSLINDLKQCAPTRKDVSGELDRFSKYVVEYAKDLETSSLEDINRTTVQNEKYWKTILVLAAGDNTALFTRLLLLMREGLLKRAEMILLYCYYDQNKDWERDKIILQTVSSDIKAIENESNSAVEEGIKEWDRGDRQKAIELYHKALTIYPKNPWALYEISYDHLTYDLTAQEILNGKNEPYYTLIRHLDPMYMIAYQGKPFPNRPQAVQALTNKVVPSYRKLWNGEDVFASMKELADGYFEMQEYELALYAYKYLLFHTYDKEFDQDLISQISICLAELKMTDVTDFLNDWLSILGANRKS